MQLEEGMSQWQAFIKVKRISVTVNGNITKQVSRTICLGLSAVGIKCANFLVP